GWSCFGKRGVQGDGGGEIVGTGRCRRGGVTEHLLPRRAHLADGAEAVLGAASEGLREEGGEVLAQSLGEVVLVERDLVGDGSGVRLRVLAVLGVLAGGHLVEHHGCGVALGGTVVEAPRRVAEERGEEGRGPGGDLGGWGEGEGEVG